MRGSFHKITLLTLAALAACVPAGAKAQGLSQPDVAEQAQRLRDLQAGQPPQGTDGTVAPLYTGEEADTGEQFLLATAPGAHWHWLNVSFDSQYSYTSNAELTRTGEKQTGMLISTAQAELEIPPVMLPYGPLFTRAGFLYQWFDYGIGGPGDDFSDLDFDVMTTYVEGEYDLPDQWSIFANLSYTRLMDDGNGYDEFYKELTPALSVEKQVSLSSNVKLTAAYTADYRFTSEAPFAGQGRGYNNRADQAVTVIVNWQATPKIEVGPFYRFQYSYYPSYLVNESRDDCVHTLGLSAEYSFNSWSSVRVFLTYEVRDSNRTTYDYHDLDTGGGLSAGFRF
jgi:hypothetical protein